MTYTATLHNPQQAVTLIEELRPRIKARLQAGKRLHLSITEETKSREQEEKYHALIGDIIGHPFLTIFRIFSILLKFTLRAMCAMCCSIKRESTGLTFDALVAH